MESLDSILFFFRLLPLTTSVGFLRQGNNGKWPYITTKCALFQISPGRRPVENVLVIFLEIRQRSDLQLRPVPQGNHYVPTPGPVRHACKREEWPLPHWIDFYHCKRVGCSGVHYWKPGTHVKLLGGLVQCAVVCWYGFLRLTVFYFTTLVSIPSRTAAFLVTSFKIADWSSKLHSMGPMLIKNTLL